MVLVRQPAVAGQFYAADAAGLATTVKTLLGEAGQRGHALPKALIVPHAGYIYSGPVAASGYACLEPYRDRYDRVVLLGPCHRLPVSGFAVSSADAFRTPLGDVPLDRQTTAAIDIPGVQVYDAAHAAEHSLEVHLPFLQATLGNFRLVPIVVGDAAPELVADLLDALWDGPETLLVISSDLSHYLPYDAAVSTDAVTRDAIERLDASCLSHDHACGATPIAGLLLAARRHGLTATTLDLRNSGDTNGEKAAVVGYGAWVFTA